MFPKAVGSGHLLFYQYIMLFYEHKLKIKQEGQRCPKRRVAQVAIRLATAVTCNLGYIIVSML